MSSRRILRFSKSEALYERALRTIPLATQTFSKAALNFVQGASPLFMERGDGAAVWDVDGNRYVDYVLGLLPIIFGYRDADVDNAIRAQLDKGIAFSLATELEAEVAERLVRLIPCAEMVRFGKNGSDATSAAVRLARAHTGRDRIAVCGYHGWHDWYIGTTTRHLGVPAAVRDLSTSIPYGDLGHAERLFAEQPNAFAAVVLEPATPTKVSREFLVGLRALTEKYGVVLVFDEIVTGFRLHIGGAQAAYGVTPDLACVGKAMANGMPISAVVGRRDIMRRMEDIFFSGTFGGEALSLAATITTLDKLERTDTAGKIHATGKALTKAFTAALASKGLADRFSIVGHDWRPVIQTNPSDPNVTITTSLLRQEFIAAGLFMASGINLCLSHAAPDVRTETESSFATALDAVAAALASPNPASFLRGEPVRPVFQVRG